MIDQLAIITALNEASNHQRTLPFVKQLGVKNFLSKLQEPFDAEAVAKKCVINPKSKYYKMDWKEVVKQWTTKAKYKAATGTTLDSYIGSKLTGIDIPKDSLQDDNTRLQSEQFDDLYHTTLNKFQFIAREQWMNYVHNGIRILGRFDALFANKVGNLLLIDWKQNDEITTDNIWKKLKGPCKHLDDCKLVFFTLQLYTYRYIFNKYDIPLFACAIGHITTSSNKLLSTAFKYDESFMKEVLDYCSSEN